MEDQFNGRTDDDLFADDFEPAAAADVEISYDTPASRAEPASDAPAAADATSIPPAPQTNKVDSTAPSAPTGPKSLSHSRHAHPASAPRQPRKASTTATPSSGAPSSDAAAAPPSTSNSSAPTTVSAPAAAPASKPTPSAPKDREQAPRPAGTGASASNGPASGSGTAGGESRLKSGANPRTKLTDEELAAKMERMRILAAEKTRKFEQAQRDESEHAAAYERGMEQARKRRAAEEERRKHDAENRKRMDEEREKNRERKLQAMGMKEGGWDEGKEERMAEEDRRGMFRGANGGVRGARDVGLGGGQYSTRDGDESRDYNGFSDRGGRGRGRGRGRGGRGGRGGYERGLFDENENGRHQNDARPSSAPAPAPVQRVPKTEDFPALPGAKPAPVDTKSAAKSLPKSVIDIPLSPPVGKWDEEVAALDATKET